jgi:hypothetical protein
MEEPATCLLQYSIKQCCTWSGDGRPARPRHTAVELTRLFDAMHDSRVDPRFALAFDLGGEQRLGQVLRCSRSNLELTAVMLDHGDRLQAGELGVLRIPSAGNKKTSPIALTFDQRIAVESALTGYLAEYEALYRVGNLSDFPLFPAGRMKKGRAKVTANAKHLNRDGALKMFRRLEEIAKWKASKAEVGTVSGGPPPKSPRTYNPTTAF